ncbi:MAG: GNAT family N-acetyltransferase [Myxococcales bacterium]|nr:GNAT family N-acetyltransferase [Myxococcales bacterium]MCB9554006.1 GNAT family N-acetyltransferase [Myxococcales bacterium]
MHESEAMFVDWALPDDPAIDAFTSGDREVDDYFRCRRWFNAATGQSKPPTYRFSVRAGGEVVGYATVALCKKPHPGEDARDKALYLVVYVVGVDRRWQGAPHPERPGETWAMAIFRWLEAKAREDGRCVGLYLRVRAANGRALAFYQKVGFSIDPASMAGEARDDALWVMRHRFEG